MKIPTSLCATSPLRSVLDLGWIGAFAVVLALLMARAETNAMLKSGVALELVAGEQRRALYRDGKRLGSIDERVTFANGAWSVEQRFRLAGAPVGAVRLRLAADLTLIGFRARADLASVPMLAQLPGKLDLGRLQVVGDCDAQGLCHVTGSLGGARISHDVEAGRGPVLTSAIYPLLARGVLGRESELSIFDPLTMRARIVTYELGVRRALQLRSGSYRALQVRQEVGGMRSEVWLDDRGRVLLERLPHLGLVVEHESWTIPAEPASRGADAAAVGDDRGAAR